MFEGKGVSLLEEKGRERKGKGEKGKKVGSKGKGLVGKGELEARKVVKLKH